MHNFNEWNNYTAIGYLTYALEHYNEVAGKSESYEDYRPLTDAEVRKIIGCMMYAFDMKTLKEAYEYEGR